MSEATPNCIIVNSNTPNPSIKNITPQCQEDIFSFVPTTETSKENILQKHLSVLRTDTEKATNDDLPPGSATIVDLSYYRNEFNYPDDRVKLGNQYIEKRKDDGTTETIISDVNSFNKEIQFVIQAAPASFEAANISNKSVTNSVYNCLYLAEKHDVQGIAFPIIGGQIFFKALNIIKNELYELLFQGVADYFNNFKDTKIQVVLFAGSNRVDDNDDFEKTFNNFIYKNEIVKDKLKQMQTGIFNAYYAYNNDSKNKTKITALVNAANTYITFNGVSGLALGFKNMLGGVGEKKETTLYTLHDKATGIDDKVFTITDNITKQGLKIKKAFRAAVDEYIKKPTAASSPSKPPATPPVEKKPFDNVIKELEGALSDQPDASVVMSNIGINSLPDFLYPPGGYASAKKNLNSAQPTIEDMVTAFETADRGETNFYLGACRSIEAAYELVSKNSSIVAGGPEMMRAKLLLNLRKNSLLLKVPARWDYAEMKLGVVSGPPDSLDGLMKFSLQDTIEYYSQDGGDGNTEFKTLNIAENPVMNWNFEWNKTGHNINGVDKRFTKGISNEGNTCFFNAALQLLLCNEDFLQLMIQGNCQDNFIDSITNLNLMNSKGVLMCSDEKFNKSKETIQILLSFFEKWLKNESFNDDGENQVVKIVTALSDVKGGGQGDSSEILVKLFENIDCCNENYILKFYNNSVTSLKITEKYPKYENINEKEVDLHEPPSPVIILKSEEIDKLMNENKLSESECKKVETNVQKLIDYYTSEQKTQYNIPSDSLSDENKTIYDYIKRLYKTQGAEQENIFGLLHLICSKIDTDISSFIKKINIIDVTADESFNTIDLIKDNDIFSGIKSDLEKIYTFLNSNNKKFTKENIQAQCENITKISDFVLKVQDSLVNPSGIFKVKKTEFKKIGKYVILSLGDRSLPDSASKNTIKNLMNVEINKNITLNSNKYILQGYSVHVGTKATGGSHYVFIKCDPKSGEEKLILDDSNITNVDNRTLDVKQRGVYSLIYKQENSSVPLSPGGGGFKPRHNPITNHTASKSRHNSSFKVSSSKTKGKSRNRSHTQRVK